MEKEVPMSSLSFRVVASAAVALFSSGFAFAEPGLPPAGFPTRDAMWSLADAGREKTACRDRISLNGLWAFKVDNEAADVSSAPKTADMRNFFKVPGKWPDSPGRARDGMAVYDEKGADVFGSAFKEITSAWYARLVDIPDA